MLFKKDIADHILTDKLQLLEMPDKVKAVLRATLSSVAAYRSAMGELHFDDQTGNIQEGNPSDQVDLSWRVAPGIVGNMFLELAEAGDKSTHCTLVSVAVS